MEFQQFLTNQQGLKGRCIFEKLLYKLAKVQSDILFLKNKEYCLIPKGFRLNNPVKYFEHSTTQHKTFKICIKASELLRNETLQLCYHHQRYVIKEIKERKQFLSQRLLHSFDELSQCLTTFLKQKKSYFCRIKLNKLNHLWSSHLYFHTFAKKKHSNRSSVLLLSEWTPYPNDSISKKNNIVNFPKQNINN